STSQEGRARSSRTTPTSCSPSWTTQPSSCSGHHSSSSSSGARAAGTSRSLPRRASACARVVQLASRRIGCASVPARRTISSSWPSTTSVQPASRSATRGCVTWKLPSSPCGLPTRPAWRSGISVDDVDEHAAVLLHRRRLHDQPQRVGGATAAADHLAVVVVGDRQLEHERAVVLLELLDGHLVRLVDELAGEVFEQLFQEALMPCVLSSLLTVSDGCAPFASQWRTRSSSSTIVDGCVWAL